MEMASNDTFQIVWSKLAEDDFSSILDYLYENWSINTKPLS